jgi:hypothetical protein
VLVSIAFHAAILIAGTTFVVFKLMAKKVEVYSPIVVNRPEMDLVKPVIKVKENTSRSKPTDRIQSTRTATLTDIQLPPPTDMGKALSSVGAFEMMVNLNEMSLFGTGKSVGNDLVGEFYDLKRNRNGTIKYDTADDAKLAAELRKFYDADWSTAVFAPFYKAPAKLYATQIFVPSLKAADAPEKFGIKEAVEPMMWVVIYKGKIAYTNDIKFRFSGYGDDLLLVRINKKMVLNGSHQVDEKFNDQGWANRSPDNKKRWLGLGRARVGDWVELKANEPVEIEVLLGEVAGDLFSGMLFVEVDGVKYPENGRGEPILPIFRTMPTPSHLIDEMEYGLPASQADFENGPIFSAY